MKNYILTGKSGWNLFTFPLEGYYSPNLFKEISVVVTDESRDKRFYFNEINYNNRLLYLNEGMKFWIYSKEDFNIDLEKEKSILKTLNSNFEVTNRILDTVIYKDQKKIHKPEPMIYARCCFGSGHDKMFLSSDTIFENGFENGFESEADMCCLNSSVEEVEDITSTNLQESNVDEADIIKHNGKILCYVTGNNDIIITNFSTILEKHLKEKTSDIRLFPEDKKCIKIDFNITDMYLVDEKLYVIGGNKKDYFSFWDTFDFGVWSKKSFIEIYDLKDLKNITKIDRLNIDGNIISTRFTNNKLYIINRYLPYIEENINGSIDGDNISDSEDLITSTKEYLIPNINDKKLIDYQNSYFSSNFEDNGFLVSLIEYNPKDNEINYKTILGNSETIYSSNKTVVIVSKNKENSVIYGFDITNGIKLLGNCEVEGHLLNQFSISEVNNIIRIATTSGSSFRNNTNNYLYTLIMENDNLKVADCYKDFGKIGEKIYGVRFLGNIAYIVTFKQTDPLYTFDTSDPFKIKYLGELEIPGYSKYFHPVDNEKILSIGRGSDDKGNESGVLVQLFDIRDLTNVKLIDKIKLGSSWNDYSPALNNHKDFVYRDSDRMFGFGMGDSFTFWNSGNNSEDFNIFKIDEWNINKVKKIEVNSSDSRGMFLTYKNTDYVLLIDKYNIFVESI